MALILKLYGIYQSPGDWMAALLQFFFGYLEAHPFGPLPTYRLDNYQGRSALVVEGEFGGGDTQEQWLVLWPVHEASQVPMQYLTSSVGWCPTLSVNDEWANIGTPDEIMGFLQEYLTLTLVPFVNSITGNTVEELSLSNRAIANEHVLNISVFYRIVGEEDLEFCTIKFTTWSSQNFGTVELVEKIFAASPMPLSGPAVTTGDIAEQLNKLTDAVESITDQDAEFGINHQAQVWSVKSKIVTGE